MDLMKDVRYLFVLPDSKFNLANFMRANLYASLEVLKVGMDILLKEEKVAVDEILGHGGLFKDKRRWTEHPGSSYLTHRYLLWRQPEKAEHGESHFLHLT